MKFIRILGLLTVLISSIAWSLASPVGSASDDNYHLASIWCSHGLEEGRCEAGSQGNTRKVPSVIANAGLCYLYDNEKSAKCTNDEIRSNEFQMTETRRLAPFDPLGGRQSLFYWVNGLLVTDNIELSITLMRLLNGGLLVILFAIAWKCFSSGREVGLVILLTSVPVFNFVVNSTSSSSWTFLGTGFAWYFTYSLFDKAGNTTRQFAMIGLLTCVALCVGSRSEAILFLILQIGFIAAFRFRHNFHFGALGSLRSSGVIPVLFITFLVTVVWLMGKIPNPFSYVFDDTPLVRDARSVLVYNVQALPSLYVGLLGGIRGVGASDTEVFGVVQYLMIGVISYVCFASIRSLDRKAAAIIFSLIVIMFALPIQILQMNRLFVGEELVPRYLYPLLALLVALFVLAGRFQDAFSFAQSLTIGVAVGIANSVSLRIVILRYTHGIEQYGLLNLDKGREWWWTGLGVVTPLTVWIVGSIAFMLWAVLVATSQNHHVSAPSNSVALPR